MRNLRQFSWIFALIAICNVSCRRDDLSAPMVSQFVYDGMSLYYLWNEQMLNRRPTAAHTNPVQYFNSLLYTPTDRWSWITDDVDALLGNFAGQATHAFGFASTPLLMDEATGRVEGFVRYIYPNTPAEEMGIARGDIIVAANGTPLNRSNFRILFGATGTTTFTVYDQHREKSREVSITPRTFTTNSVFHSSIHRFDDSDRVIGYLFYTAFRSNFNDDLHRVFSEFQQAGVTDLVLDLRYNPGGDVSAAVYLASMIAPRTAVTGEEVFITMNYNRFVNQLFDNQDNEMRLTRLGEFQERFANPLTANLNLSRVFIIATEFSASASELTIFCLRPFMEVNHIGDETSGKYTASWTIHAFDNFAINRQPRAQIVYSRPTNAQRSELQNWAMQPIVAEFTNKRGETFAADGTLIPNFQMESFDFLRSPELWKPIGDENDYFFAKAISLITGRPHTTATRNASNRQFIGTPLFSPQETLLRRAVNVDNMEIEPEMWQKMLESLR